MSENYTHITVILDRTGSMESIRDDTIGGFNAFLAQQKAEPGLATLTLVQFDTQDPYEVVHRFILLGAVPELTRHTYIPRASTPLLDAMGRGIIDLEKSIADMKGDQPPSRVVFVVITDGQENSSREFRKDQVEKMIKDKQEKCGWQFVFLSADLAAIEDALTSGVQASGVMAFDKTGQGTSDAWASVSGRVADYRASRRPNVSFTEDDRAKQMSERKRK
jgi:hypothetical protein